MDEFIKLYVDELGLFFNLGYLNAALVLAVISGTMRTVWWLWYWVRFSEIDPPQVCAWACVYACV
jgi:hypothetical protein